MASDSESTQFISGRCFYFSQPCGDIWKTFLLLATVINARMSSFFHLVGAELHCGYGGEDAAVRERAQAVPGVRPRGAQLLETALQ